MKYIKSIFTILSGIVYNRNECGQIYKVYDANHCLIRYSMMRYRKEKIKDVYMPKYVDKAITDKIMFDISDSLQNKSFNVKRLIHHDSIYLYDDEELVNNRINNVIVENIIMADHHRAIAILNAM